MVFPVVACPRVHRPQAGDRVPQPCGGGVLRSAALALLCYCSSAAVTLPGMARHLPLPLIQTKGCKCVRAALSTVWAWPHPACRKTAALRSLPTARPQVRTQHAHREHGRAGHPLRRQDRPLAAVSGCAGLIKSVCMPACPPAGLLLALAKKRLLRLPPRCPSPSCDRFGTSHMPPCPRRCSDKRVVREPDTEKDVWWGAGSPNYEMDEK